MSATYYNSYKSPLVHFSDRNSKLVLAYYNSSNDGIVTLKDIFDKYDIKFETPIDRLSEMWTPKYLDESKINPNMDENKRLVISRRYPNGKMGNAVADLESKEYSIFSNFLDDLCRTLTINIEGVDYPIKDLNIYDIDPNYKNDWNVVKKKKKINKSQNKQHGEVEYTIMKRPVSADSNTSTTVVETAASTTVVATVDVKTAVEPVVETAAMTTPQVEPAVETAAMTTPQVEPAVETAASTEANHLINFNSKKKKNKNSKKQKQQQPKLGERIPLEKLFNSAKSDNKSAFKEQPVQIEQPEFIQPRSFNVSAHMLNHNFPMQPLKAPGINNMTVSCVPNYALMQYPGIINDKEKEKRAQANIIGCGFLNAAQINPLDLPIELWAIIGNALLPGDETALINKIVDLL
jgi:hypothetical protein